jgi:ATP-dependent Zn protease
MIDAEIREIILRRYEIAFGKLSDKKDLLAKWASLLLEKEAIGGEELRQIIEAS